MSSPAPPGIGRLLSSTSRSFKASHVLPDVAPQTLISRSPTFRAPPPVFVRTRNVRPPFVVAAGNRQLMGSVTNTKGLRFDVVVARFNEIITNPLLEGALQTFRQYSVKEEDNNAIYRGSVHGIHPIWISSNNILNNLLVVKVPGSFEIPNVAQKLGKSGAYDAVLCIGAVAMNRAGGKSGNKGAEAALTAIEMASLFQQHLKK